MRATCARTSSTVMSSDSSTRAASLLLAQQAEQDVLRADVVVEGAGLVLREDDDLASPFSESLEQPFDPPSIEISGGQLIRPPGRRSGLMV